MSVDTTMAVLYAQSGLAAPFVNAAAVAPQASAAMSRIMAIETARQEQQQIKKTEKADAAGVAADGRQGGQFAFAHRRRRYAPLPSDEEDDDSPRPPDSPLVGNLLNVKV